MKIFLTGATGFVGSHILKRLVNEGHFVYCLARKSGTDNIMNHKQVRAVTGDVTKPETLEKRLSGCDAVIHLVAVIKEKKNKNITFERLNYLSTKNMLESAVRQGVKRFIYMSALGADVNGETPYFRTKGRAEIAVIQSGLLYTIFRPSFIFGPGDGVYSMLANVIRKSPFGLFPVFGSGDYLHQPVSVYNVSDAFVSCIQNPKTINKIYEIGGPKPLSYNEQLQILGKTVGKKIRKVNIPLFLAKPVVKIAGTFPFSPIDADRLKMLVKNNVTDNALFLNDIPVELLSFDKGLTEYIHNS
ncbi:complex I NDUFA9 subunit family protein [candidate division KSB1 bacterium]|nr:complex I NDUFA9 subunit family protein [candidate division KSB1 bacterium]